MKNKNLNIGNMIIWLIGIFGLIIAISIGKTFAKLIGFPVVLVVIGYSVINYIVKERKKYITTAIAVQTGHLLWLLALILFYIEYNSIVWIGVFILILGLVWIYIRVSLVSISFLVIYQTASMFGNINSLINLNSEPALIPSLVFHIILRIVAIVLMILGYKEFRRNKEITKLKISSTSHIMTEPEKLEELKVGSCINTKERGNEEFNNSSWLCICGTSNISTDKNCKMCEISRDFILKNYSNDEIIKIQINSLKKKLGNREKQYDLKRVLNKRAIIVASVLIIIITIGIGFSGQLTSFYSTYRLKTYYNINLKDINNVNPGYDTYLMGAVKRKDVNQVKLLLECGADVNINNDYGVSALDFGVDTNNTEIVKLLLQNGAIVTNADVEKARTTNLAIAKLLNNDINNSKSNKKTSKTKTNSTPIQFGQ